MEEFIIIFKELKETPKELDYYLSHNLEIKRVFTFPEIGIKEYKYSEFKKRIPILCSKTICLEDKILFEYKHEFDIQEGVVNELDFDNQIVRISFRNSIIHKNFKHCYYPIIEIYNDLDNFKNKQIVLREDLNLKSICPACYKVARKIGICDKNNDICQRNNLKQYAYIKSQKT